MDTGLIRDQRGQPSLSAESMERRDDSLYPGQFQVNGIPCTRIKELTQVKVRAS